MAIRFDNVADFLSRTTIPTTTSPFTWMTWIYLTSTTGGNQEILTGIHAGPNTTFYIGADDAPLTRLVDWDWAAASGTALSTGVWYHVALVRTATPSWIGYLNGVSDLTLNATGEAATSMRVGVSGAGSDRFDGRVEAMKMWTVQLTAPQILAERFRYDPVVTANSWAWWPLTAHTDVTDHSANARHWTANGTLTTEAGPGGISEGAGPSNTDRQTVVGAGTLAGVAPTRVVGVVTIPQTP